MTVRSFVARVEHELERLGRRLDVVVQLLESSVDSGEPPSSGMEVAGEAVIGSLENVIDGLRKQRGRLADLLNHIPDGDPQMLPGMVWDAAIGKFVPNTKD